MIEAQGPPINLPEVIEEAIGFASEHLVGKQVGTVAEYPAHLPAVTGDRKHLVTVAACLLQQAGHSTERGEVKVRAELLTAENSRGSSAGGQAAPPNLSQGGPWVLLSVSFEPGSAEQAAQVEALTDPEAGGKRWLDPECSELLDEHGDYFWLSGSPDDGFRFNLALPIWAAYGVSTDVSSLRRAVENRLGASEKQLGSTLLLMVEDEEVGRVLSDDLQAAGYRVVIANSGEEVLSLARQESPELVLLDLVARAPTAFEVAGLLKHDRRTRGLPVLFLTSVDDPQGGVSMGTVGFLPRQADTGAVISAVNAVLTAGLKPLSRVLVVEQDDRLRDRMVMTIQGQGYRVSEATRPEEAMALAERATPDIALVNAKLAQERDYWLLRGLRNTAREAEIYVMADVMDKQQAKAALKRGASGYSETGQLPDLLDRMRKRNQGES